MRESWILAEFSGGWAHITKSKCVTTESESRAGQAAFSFPPQNGVCAGVDPQYLQYVQWVYIQHHSFKARRQQILQHGSDNLRSLHFSHERG